MALILSNTNGTGNFTLSNNNNNGSLTLENNTPITLTYLLGGGEDQLCYGPPIAQSIVLTLNSGATSLCDANTAYGDVVGSTGYTDGWTVRVQIPGTSTYRAGVVSNGATAIDFYSYIPCSTLNC
jgi:hypothetical protein